MQLETEQNYTVEITTEAEQFYNEILDYFYQHHSDESADKKSNELLEAAISLESNPQKGTQESKLEFLDLDHRFILYFYTTRKAIKIIYFIDEPSKSVFITDFFPCESDNQKIKKRSC